MNMLDELNIVFRDVLENEKIELSEETTSEDIDEWDSINHIYLIDEIEKQFGVKFKSSELLTWKDIGELIDLIKTKLSKH